jgi:cysteine sulfinate desulfinase/cysteine desulfurase-like protein
LSDIQHTLATKDDVWAMVQSIHKTVSAQEKSTRDADLKELFETFWDKELAPVIATLQAEQPAPPAPMRPQQEMLAEVLELVHDVRRQTGTEGWRQMKTLLLVAQLYRQVTGQRAPSMKELEAMQRSQAALDGLLSATDDAPGPEPRLPQNLHVSFPGVEGAKLLQSLHDVAVSSGSACSSQKLDGSHVLRALRLPDARIFSAVRFGLGRATTEADIDQAAARVVSEVRRLRG